MCTGANRLNSNHLDMSDHLLPEDHYRSVHFFEAIPITAIVPLPATVTVVREVGRARSVTRWPRAARIRRLLAAWRGALPAGPCWFRKARSPAMTT